jgi:hypothetical protein
MSICAGFHQSTDKIPEILPNGQKPLAIGVVAM